MSESTRQDKRRDVPLMVHDIWRLLSTAKVSGTDLKLRPGAFVEIAPVDSLYLGPSQLIRCCLSFWLSRDTMLEL